MCKVEKMVVGGSSAEMFLETWDVQSGSDDGRER
jgi:hypothetical protein